MAALSFEDLRVPPQRAPDLEVLPVDDPLYAGDLRAHDRVLDGTWPRGASAPGEQIAEPVAHHQVVVEADEEARLAGITLPAGAAAQLQVDAAAFMTIRADHVQPAAGGDAIVLGRVPAPEPDVGAASGHVRRNGDGAGPARVRDDVRLLLVVPGVQHRARNPGRGQPRCDPLRLLNRQLADQYRLPD